MPINPPINSYVDWNPKGKMIEVRHPQFCPNWYKSGHVEQVRRQLCSNYSFCKATASDHNRHQSLQLDSNPSLENVDNVSLPQVVCSEEKTQIWILRNFLDFTKLASLAVQCPGQLNRWSQPNMDALQKLLYHLVG